LKAPVSILVAALTAGLFLSPIGCAKSPDEAAAGASAADAPAPAGVVRGTVLETMDSGGYTYALIETAEGQRWVASRQASVSVGDVVQTTEGMPMNNFTSPSLERTFEVIYFSDTLQNLSTGADQAALPHPLPEGHPPTEMPAGHPDVGDAAGAGAVDAVVAELTPGQDIAYVYANKDTLAGQPISLRGKVVKYNDGIMGRNWIHIQDGSGDAAAGSHDLLVTTQGTAAVGDTVVVTGNVAVNKDFGAGYSFPVLVEDASVTTE
jgi:hypothetical protein